MIIACPACNTRYVVPDTAIGVEGRTVRCAKCKHSWFQDGPEIETPAPPAPAPPPPAPEPTPDPEPEPESETETVEEPATEADETEGPAPKPSVSHWKTPGKTQAEAEDQKDATETEDATEAESEVEEEAPAPPAYEAPVAEPEPEPEPVFYDHDDDGSQFDYEPPFRPRRNPLKLWTAAAAVFAVIALGTVAAVSYWGVPDWFPANRPTFGANQPSLQLDFPPDQQDRRTLPNGTEYFGASGTVTNIGRETVSVPPILIIMRDERDRIVYNWEIAPPQSDLAPGETISIREAVTDVPRSAKFAEIGWKPG